MSKWCVEYKWVDRLWEGRGVSSYMESVIQNATILELEAEAVDGDDEPKKKRQRSIFIW